MITVFEGIPDIFVERYDAQFEMWGREFRTRGRKCAIVFDRLPGETPSFDAADRLVWSGCWLTADIEEFRGHQAMIIRPASEWDKNMVEEHAWNLRRWMLQ